jgi:starvation-inducible DNA-binding protein
MGRVLFMATTLETKRLAKPFPSSSQLATVTDLTQQEARAITEGVNPLIADAFALYVKTKNFHWHLYGPHFRDYHLLFDEQAGAILESIDVMAERVRKVGGSTIKSIGQISQLQTIRDDNDELVPGNVMVRRLMEDNAHVAEKLRGAIAVCDRNRDSATSNSLQEILDATERRKWFLFEMLQG